MNSLPGSRDRPSDAVVAAFRSFNRFYTNLIGVLREGVHRTPYSLTEARVIFELAQDGVMETADLRRTLNLDGGYLSRILARLESEGLARRQRSSSDRRRQTISLTQRGRSAFKALDRRSSEEVRALLMPLTVENQHRLLGATELIRTILDDAPPSFSYLLRPPLPGDYGWVVNRHGVLYAHEYGWNESFEALVARIVADYIDHRDLRREGAWIAEMDGEPVGCIFCVRREEKVAQLRLMLVEPRARGRGIGTRLVQECLRFAGRARYERVMLWTNDVLHDARRVYERAGFELIETEEHHSFGRDLVGQYWSRSLEQLAPG
jgi:DNA-binding MarR family transcriptional regulator/GNAT superfamily N-acetyltransferase